MDTQRENSLKMSNFKSAMQSIIGKDDRNYYQIVFKETSKRHAEGDTETILVDSVVMGVSRECQIRFGDDCSTISRHHRTRWKPMETGTFVASQQHLRQWTGRAGFVLFAQRR